jgi:hypothetical protein
LFTGMMTPNDSRRILGQSLPSGVALFRLSPSLWVPVWVPGESSPAALLKRKPDRALVRSVVRTASPSNRFAAEKAPPSALECLLAERVVATWLQVQVIEGLHAVGMKGETPIQDDHLQKRLDQAHRRHLSAIRTLAQIRKLGPAVQINIAEKQINTSG